MGWRGVEGYLSGLALTLPLCGRRRYPLAVMAARLADVAADELPRGDAARRLNAVHGLIVAGMSSGPGY